MVYYNENDHDIAAWLREIIRAGLIAAGEVDERSIADVRAAELVGFTQHHFFAGIGGWSYALRLAGWPDSRAVWTGSCPCQPFSNAGRATGFSDSRHCWPYWARLVAECKPVVIFGEQVASPDGLAWFDFVCADLEAAAYTVGAVDTCAAGAGAPHARQRLYFVADTACTGTTRAARTQNSARQTCGFESVSGGGLCDMEHPDVTRLQGRSVSATDCERGDRGECVAGPSSAAGGFWADAEWIACTDGKSRPVKPGIFPLAYGVSARVLRLRGYGNAIVAPVAAQFIQAYLSITQ